MPQNGKNMKKGVGRVRLDRGYVRFKLRQNARIKGGRLLVSPEEGLVVEAPRTISLRHAHKMIGKKRDWVIQALKEVRQSHKLVNEIKKHDRSLFIFGKERQLIVKRAEPKDCIRLTKHKLILGFADWKVSPTQIKERLQIWLRNRARRYLTARARHLGQRRFDYTDVVVKDQKNLWGSCSSTGKLYLNWRLIMAPRFASDYIIVHELCHTRHLNHSQKYWQSLKRYKPHYQRAEEWFDQFGFILYMDPLEKLLL